MRRVIKPRLNWPRSLRNKWIPVVLFALILFAYELFGLWSSPWLTAWIIVGYFAGVLLVDGLFKHAAFCKFVCPIGQFNFLAAGGRGSRPRGLLWLMTQPMDMRATIMAG